MTYFAKPFRSGCMIFLSYLAAQANGILYWAKRWHVCLAAFSTFWAVCTYKPRQHTKSIWRGQKTKTSFIQWPGSRLQSVLQFCAGEDLVYIGCLYVRLCTVRDAILQHLLDTGNQEDICVRVGHWEDGLQEEKISVGRTPKCNDIFSFSATFFIFCKKEFNLFF